VLKLVDISQPQPYSKYMKKSVVLFLAFFVALTTIPAIANAAESTLSISSVKTKYQAGESVEWAINFDGNPNARINYLELFIVDPAGNNFRSSWSDQKESGQVFSGSARLEDKRIFLKTHENLSNGLYTLSGARIFTYCETCEKKNEEIVFALKTSPLLKSFIAPNIINLAAGNFEIVRSTSNSNFRTPAILDLGLKGKDYSPGDKIPFKIKLDSDVFIWHFVISVRSPSGRLFTWQGFNDDRDWGGSLKMQFNPENATQEIIFDADTGENFPPGVYTIQQIIMEWQMVGPKDFSNSPPNTRFWGGTFFQIIENGVSRFDGFWESKYKAFEVPVAAFRMLDAGQGDLKDPKWNSISWVKTKGLAGEIQEVQIEIDASQYYVTEVCVGNFINLKTGKMINEYFCDPVIYPSNTRYATSERIKKGTFRIPVYFKRNIDLGSYAISYVSVNSSSCLNQSDIRCNNANQLASNTFNTYELAGGKPKWSNFVDPRTVGIELNGVAPLVEPTVEFTDIKMDSYKFSPLLLADVNCDFEPKTGVLSKEPYSKVSQSNSYQVDNLPPDTDVLLNIKCSAVDGAKLNFSKVIHTLKPTPPAITKLVSTEIATNYLVFSFNRREEIEYRVIADVGKVVIDGPIVRITNLIPGQVVSLKTFTSDRYGQTTESPIFLATTSLPPKPDLPALVAIRNSQNSIELRYSQLPEFSYDLSISDGEVSDRRGFVSISKLLPGTKVLVLMTVTDKYGQSTKSEKMEFQTLKPPLPPVPLILLTSSTPESLTIKFATRENISYQIQTEWGKVDMGIGVATISGLRASQTVELRLVMLDGYDQKQVSKEYVFTTKPVAPKRKLSITCISGKSSKVITAVNPTCPAGYKLKK
jgi:hypothetical protein